MMRYDILDIFILYTPYDSVKNPIDTRVSMFEEDEETTEEEVRASNKFLNQYGKDYDVQNLEWIMEFLENSSSPEFWDKVNKRMFKVPTIDQGGPLWYSYALKLILSNTEDSIRATTKRVTELRLI